MPMTNKKSDQCSSNDDVEPFEYWTSGPDSTGEWIERGFRLAIVVVLAVGLVIALALS